MQQTRIIQITSDGSHTIAIPELHVTYHSKYGAIQESLHVFIQEGLQYFLQLHYLKKDEPLNILEIGFGTGLNALLSLNEAIHLNQKISYETIEPFSISYEETRSLNYAFIINQNLEQAFFKMHDCNYHEDIFIHSLFSFKKINNLLQNFSSSRQFHIIYFDAFDPNTQPELWTEVIFKKVYQMLYKNGTLVTYCSKSIVRKALLAAGFSVQKLKGPPGKREIIRAVK